MIGLEFQKRKNPGAGFGTSEVKDGVYVILSRCDPAPGSFTNPFGGGWT
jgi:hypothetical protein